LNNSTFRAYISHFYLNSYIKKISTWLEKIEREKSNLVLIDFLGGGKTRFRAL
jgi:hypothetical protein